ncbi:MAG: hypothetical protein AAFV95_18635 [Bacteroidota bacterium]
MNRSVASILLLALVMLTSQACRKSKGDPTFSINIDDEFYIDLWEGLTPEYQSIHLKVATIQYQVCPEVILDYGLENLNKRYTVTLNDLIAPENCSVDSTYISTEIDLGDLENGEYELRINLRDIENKGKLTVDDQRLSISMESDHGIALRHDELFRIPEKAIWGYLAYNAPAYETTKNAFFDDLQAITNLRNYTSGYYGYFTIEDDGYVRIARQIDFDTHSPFLLQFNGDKQELVDLLTAYRNQLGNDADLYLYTYEGEQL